MFWNSGAHAAGDVTVMCQATLLIIAAPEAPMQLLVEVQIVHWPGTGQPRGLDSLVK